MKLDPGKIARASLGLLNETGLDGLTMRVVARELDVKAPALYWHLRNKQELLDAMAELIFTDTAEGLVPPAEGVEWDEWLADLVRRLRAALLGYRDGARVFAGTHMSHPAMYQTIELTLTTLRDAGFSPERAAHGVSTLLHYTVGFTIEEQARTGVDYEENPYRPDRVAGAVDPQRFPLSASVVGELFSPDPDDSFERGLRLILSGMRASSLHAAQR
ncbi:MAG: TetR/AcrR family transcriptional regulator C-terminal domain-containing protein [Actinocatenispora sp.]